MATPATRGSATIGLLCATALVIAGCGGGGGGGHGNGGGGGASANATVSGHVASVNSAAAARLDDGASAATISCAGIVVRAERDGDEVDVTTTNASCDFTLQVPGGDVTLVFVVDGFTVTKTISVPPDSVLIIIVVLSPGGVEIDNPEVHGTIDCEHGDVRIDARGSALVIDANGDDCIRAGGNCTVTIDADAITLRHCETCIRVAGTADVQLTTATADFTCSAGEDGIKANGNATVHVASAGRTTIDADEDGIDAEGTPDVVVDSVGFCSIAGGQSAVLQRGDASVDVGDCALNGG